RPVTSGSTPAKPSAARSSASTNASITRTGLFSSIQSSRHSGNRVLCPRSTPSKKRFIKAPQIILAGKTESHRANQKKKNRVSTQPGSSFLLPDGGAKWPLFAGPDIRDEKNGHRRPSGCFTSGSGQVGEQAYGDSSPNSDV